MNKFISIALVFTSIVLLMNYGNIDAACITPETSSSTKNYLVEYCKQFYNSRDANPLADCSANGDSDCTGGLVCINDGFDNKYCECPIYKAIQSQIVNYAYNDDTEIYNCTSPLLNSGFFCFFAPGSPCAGDYFCSDICTDNVCTSCENTCTTTPAHLPLSVNQDYYY